MRPSVTFGQVAAVACFVAVALLYALALFFYGQHAVLSWIDWLDPLSFAVWIFTFALVGALIAYRQPRNRVAWLCLAFALIWSLWTAAEAALQLEMASPGTWSNPELLAALSYPLWVPGVGLIAYLLLLFPNGKLPSPRWKILSWTLTASMALLGIAAFFLPGLVQDTNFVNPLGIEAFAPFYDGLPSYVLVLALIGSLAASAVAVLVRFRRARGVERLQMKWLLAAGVLAAVGYPVMFFQEFTVQLLWALIPAAIGFALHRHRLYDIDRLLSRTTSYAVVIACLALVFAGVVFVLGGLLPQEGDLAVAGSTLSVAALFNPVRRRVQDRVDRLFNRSRYDAQRIIKSFEGKLRNEVDLGGVVDGWTGVVSATLKPSSMSVWVRGE